jgi:hypothetical protein
MERGLLLRASGRPAVAAASSSRARQAFQAGGCRATSPSELSGSSRRSQPARAAVTTLTSGCAASSRSGRSCSMHPFAQLQGYKRPLGKTAARRRLRRPERGEDEGEKRHCRGAEREWRGTDHLVDGRGKLRVISAGPRGHHRHCQAEYNVIQYSNINVCGNLNSRAVTIAATVAASDSHCRYYPSHRASARAQLRVMSRKRTRTRRRGARSAATPAPHRTPP